MHVLIQAGSLARLRAAARAACATAALLELADAFEQDIRRLQWDEQQPRLGGDPGGTARRRSLRRAP
jgi:hypothetical protein